MMTRNRVVHCPNSVMCYAKKFKQFQMKYHQSVLVHISNFLFWFFLLKQIKIYKLDCKLWTKCYRINKLHGKQQQKIIFVYKYKKCIKKHTHQLPFNRRGNENKQNNFVVFFSFFLNL